MRITLSIIMLALGVTALPTAATEDPCMTLYQDVILPEAGREDADFVAFKLGQSSCILGSSDTTGIVPLYKPLFDQFGEAGGTSQCTTSADFHPVEISQLRHRVFERVLEDLGDSSAGTCESEGAPGCLIEQQTQAVSALGQMLDGAAVDRENKLISHAGTNWRMHNVTGTIAASDIDVRAYLTIACADIASSECRQAVDVTARILRSGKVMIQVIAAHNCPIIEQNAQALSIRDQQWQSYFNTLSVQYPWELAWNSSGFEKAVPRQERAAFPEAPTSKWIILHPSPAFEYIETPKDGNSLEASVVLEVGGYEWWKWNGGKAENRWGFSGAISFADVSGMDEVGYGMVLHTPIKNTSLGFIMRDGDDGWEPGIVVNVDLAALIMKYSTSNALDFLSLGDQDAD